MKASASVIRLSSGLALGVTLLCAIWLLNQGCRQPVDPMEVSGVYSRADALVEEQLCLDSSGDFHQTVRYVRDGHEVAAKGVWRYNASRGYVVFDSTFLLTLDMLGRVNDEPKVAEGLVILPVRKVGSRLQIGSDENLIYVKTRDDR